MFGGARIEGQGNGQHKATSAVSKRAHAAQRRAREGVEREESPSGEVRGWRKDGTGGSLAEWKATLRVWMWTKAPAQGGEMRLPQRARLRDSPKNDVRVSHIGGSDATGP